MMPATRGLIVEVTENDIIGGAANPIAHAVKTAQKVLPLQWATGSRRMASRPRHHFLRVSTIPQAMSIR